MTPQTATAPPRPSLLSRYGPLTAIVVAIGLVAALASTGSSGSTETAATTGGDRDSGSSNDQLPIYFQDIAEEGNLEDYDFGENCDPETGRVKVPSLYSPPCAVARPGVEGGETSPGVTADEITIVLYQAADDDLAASLGGVTDAPEDALQTRKDLLALYEDRYELWGRTLNIVPLKGSGSDETSSRADAVKVAEEIDAFASIGGPGQESAYAEELARRGVVCIGCGLSLPDSAIQEYAPYLWSVGPTPEQYLLNLGDFISRLVGQKAEFAGSEELRDEERVFGVVHFEQDPPVFGGVEELAAAGADSGYEQAVNLTYQLIISDLPEKARVLVARLKEAEVTSVVFLGDPIMPIYLTQAATDQDYFPEWIVTGTVLTDTTTFGRQYDQEQWSHAFGISGIPARIPTKDSDAWTVYQWYYGEEPPGPLTMNVVAPPILIMMLGLHQAGPNLTPETFRDGLFAYPPSGGLQTWARWSFGDHGLYANPDYNGTDDMGVIWWDADAEDTDEQGKEGVGMVAYADGGQRYLPGEMPNTPANVFDDEGAVLKYPARPDDQLPPTYPPPERGGN